MMTLLHGRRSPSENNATERRRGLRIKQQRPVKVYEPRTSRYFPCQTADISLSGLRLSLPLSTPIIADNTLCLHVASAHSNCDLVSRRQMIEAKVIWMYRDKTQLMAGLELVSTAAIQSSAA